MGARRSKRQRAGHAAASPRPDYRAIGRDSRAVGRAGHPWRCMVRRGADCTYRGERERRRLAGRAARERAQSLQLAVVGVDHARREIRLSHPCARDGSGRSYPARACRVEPTRVRQQRDPGDPDSRVVTLPAWAVRYNSRMVTRRAFLHASAATGVATLTGAAKSLAAQYDLVIRGGRVIDPTRRLDSLLDVAIAGGKIVDVLPAGTATDAVSTFDATGKLVVPGLIDIHTHARSKQMPSICLADGVT